MPPIRRNLAHISQAERNSLIKAIVELDTTKLFSDGVSYWDKQDQIHQVTHIHHGTSFLPWHRELLNRFEAMLQEVAPTVALHYWDWTTDPRNTPDGKGGFVDLFNKDNFGSSNGIAGEPFHTVVAPVGPGNPRNSEAAIIPLEDGSLLLGWTEFYAGNGADHGPARISGKGRGLPKVSPVSQTGPTTSTSLRTASGGGAVTGIMA